MKRILCMAMAVLMLCSVFMMAGCEAKTVQFGMGMTSAYGTQKDADGDANGSGDFTTTAVAVALDDSGKIVAIDLDSVQVTGGWTAEGTAVETGEVQTKGELGTNYGMSAYGKKADGSEGAPLEWNEQADAFEACVTGKTLDEVKAMVGADGYATDEDMITAGCTINVYDFMVALEKAVQNAAASEASAKDTVKLAMVVSTSVKDASEEAEGAVEADVTVVAVAKNEKGAVTASKTDAVQGKMAFDLAGVAAATADVQTKGELGTNYGMSAYGKKLDGSEGAPLEWNEQAAAFDAELVGKTASEISAMVGADGYHGNDDLTSAGCTIGVSDMVNAAAKAAK